MSEEELKNRLDMVDEINRIEAKKHEVLREPEPKFKNPYDDADTAKAMEEQVRLRRVKDAPKKEILTNLMIQLPPNHAELNVLLEKLDYRLDFMKILVEEYAEKLQNALNKNKNNFLPEASALVNKCLSDYLNLIMTLKSNGYEFGSIPDSYSSSQYDPYKPDMNFPEIMDDVFMRRKNGGSVNIPIPKEYDVNNPQQIVDAISILSCVDQELSNNPYAQDSWKKIGYVQRKSGMPR